MRHALVTGATGGLGRALVPALLAAGWQVRATGRDRVVGAALEREGATFVPHDLLDELPAHLTRAIDTVFHLAALSSPWGPAERFTALHVDATRRLLSAARAAGVGRFVHVSTPSIFVCGQDRLGIADDDPPARYPANAYVRSKLAGERVVRASNSGAFQTVVLRPRAITGPYDTVLLPRLRRAMRSGRMPLPGGGRALVELSDARDVAAALIAAATAKNAAGQAFNISGGAPRTVKAIVGQIAAALGQRITPVPVPARAAMLWGALSETVARVHGREPVVTRYTVMTLAYSQTFDLSRAHSILNWQPRVTPEEAIGYALGQADA